MFSARRIFKSYRLLFAALLLFAGATFARAARASVTLSTLDFQGARATVAYGINANGDIVGDYVAKDGNLHGFFLGPDGFKDISVSGHLNTIPVKISAEGVIVGCFHDTDTMGTMHGWVRNEDGLTVYSTPASMHNGITPRGDVAGFYTDLMTMQTHGYILSKGATTKVDFPGSSATRVWDLNPRREAVGFYVDPTTHVPRGFQYHKGQFTPIDVAGARNTLPFGINPEGDVVGAYTDQNGKTHGFLLTRGDHDRSEDEEEDD